MRTTTEIPSTAASTRVATWNFRDQAVEILREQIVSGTYDSGARLNEVEIADSMGISRGPLREALQRLAAEGLVELIPHRGAFVRSFTVAELRTMYEFREIIESGAARLAAKRASPQAVTAVRESLAEAEAILSADPDAPYPAAPDFHRQILELADNPSLLAVGIELQTQIRIARRSSARKPGRARDALDEHHAIVRAIAAGDGSAAADAMARHLAKSLLNHEPATSDDQ